MGSGCCYVWKTSEIFDNLNPIWNETNSWSLLFNPTDDLVVNFELFDVDSFTNADKIGKISLKLGQIDGKPKTLQGKKCKSTSTLTVEVTKQKLIGVSENFVKNVNDRLKVDKDKDVEYATLDVVNKKLEAMQKEYESKLNRLEKEMNNKVGGITDKLDGIKNVLTD